MFHHKIEKDEVYSPCKYGNQTPVPPQTGLIEELLAFPRINLPQEQITQSIAHLLLLWRWLLIHHLLPTIGCRISTLHHRRSLLPSSHLLTLLDQGAATAAARQQAVVAAITFDTVPAAHCPASGHLEQALGRVQTGTESCPGHALGGLVR